MPEPQIACVCAACGHRHVPHADTTPCAVCGVLCRSGVCDHCGKPERFNVLCPDCERLVCDGCGRVDCCCCYE